MKRLYLLIFCNSLILSACGTKPVATAAPSQTATELTTVTVTPMPASPFTYDPSVPFDPKVTSETEQNGVTIVDLSYAAHDPGFSPNLGGRTLAYLVKPQGEGPFAGIIYLHMMGTFNQSGNTRKKYLDEAVETARHGAICLLLQGFYPWMSPPLGTENDRLGIIGEAIEMRRAVDFLLSEPRVDATRLGFVGHDYGAMYGAILSGVDPREISYDLIAGSADFTYAFRASQFVGIDPVTYPPLMKDLNPVYNIAKATGSNFFFQYGLRDSMVAKDQADQLVEPAGKTVKVTWYDELHNMDGTAVLKDRLTWLTEQLGLEPFQP